MEFQAKIESDDDITTNPFPSCPDPNYPTMAIAGTTSTRKLARVVSGSSEEITKQEEKLILMKKEKVVEDLQEEFEEARSKILELESATMAVSNELDPLQDKLSEIRAIQEPAELELEQAENELYLLKVKANGSGASIDQLNALKQEIEVSKLKPFVLGNKIEIVSLEDIIATKNERADEVKKALQDARDTVNNKELNLRQLETAIEKDRAVFTTKWKPDTPEASNRVEDKAVEVTEAVEVIEAVEVVRNDNSLTAVPFDTKLSPVIIVEQLESAKIGLNEDEHVYLKSKLDAAEQEVLRQAKEIKLLKNSKSEDETENDNISVSDASAHTEYGTKFQPTTTNLIKENQALKDRVAQMEPLWYIGYYTRARKFELDKPGRRDGNVISHGTEAFKSGNAYADATMFLGYGPEKRIPLADFQNAYKVTPSIAWEYRKFTSFQKIIGWKADMATRYKHYDATAFNKSFDKLFKAIYPSFKIDNDTLIQSDPELRGAYENLYKEIEAANRIEKFGGSHAVRPTNTNTPAKPSETTQS